MLKVKKKVKVTTRVDAEPTPTTDANYFVSVGSGYERVVPDDDKIADETFTVVVNEYGVWIETKDDEGRHLRRFSGENIGLLVDALIGAELIYQDLYLDQKVAADV